MKTTSVHCLKAAALIATLLGTMTMVQAGTGAEQTVPSPLKVMEIDFEARAVAKADLGYFRFVPGQVAPVHHHLAPAIGLVSSGRIIYQAEGEQARILDEGEAFYEPAGPSILRFDNMSATEPAVFIDFSLQREGEPFIALDEEPAQPIDRTSLPSLDLGGRTFGHVDVYSRTLPASASVELSATEPLIGIVAEGVVELRLDGGETTRLVEGNTFALIEDGASAELRNGSSDVDARLVTYHLR